ncbi:gpW family protein [Methylobacterium sp. J-090]|uniref:gpW family protein n=1 Tax=Methylobacterium sp. J-090 TaxID=2836666 RepID=UPI001FBA8461|nr:gpW family protein [Methylobacterium sp. J-090]MCJ2080739.1 gpW family protein [Methylobacterium sp. J-090]
MADVTTLRLRLTQAEEALHKVATGQTVELLEEDGSTVRFTKANRKDLEAYISTLGGQIADATVPSRRRGPVQFVF